MLTETQTELIINDVEQANIHYSHLRDDLIDHVCCDVENEMQQGYAFSDAYKKVQQRIGYKGLKRIQDDTFFLIDKTYRKMKRTMKTTGLIAPVLLGLGALFKISHWPGASIILVLGFFTLCFLFLPTAVYIMYKETKSRKNVLLFISGIISAILISLGILFKVQHWPWAGNLFVTGTAILLLLFMPLLLWSKLKENTGKNKRRAIITGFIALLFFITGYLFKVMHWPGAAILILIGNVALFLIAVPVYARSFISNKKFIQGKFIFIILAASWLAIIMNLISIKTSKSVTKNYMNMYVKQTKNVKMLEHANYYFYNHPNFNAREEKVIQLKRATQDVLNMLKDTKHDLLQVVGQETIYYIEKPFRQKETHQFLFGNNGNGKAQKIKNELLQYCSLLETNWSQELKNTQYQNIKNDISRESWTQKKLGFSMIYVLDYLTLLQQKVLMIESDLLYLHQKQIVEKKKERIKTQK